jgi:hypothetical protein
MNQDEVYLIYDYLHENYEYKDGDFIRIKGIHGSEVGRKMGSVKIHPNGDCYFVGSFSIAKKEYNKRISHLVYLYHHKEFPRFIHYLDGNKMNTNIENIVKTRLRHENIKPTTFLQGNKTKYRVNVIVEGYLMYLGSHNKESDALQAIEVLKKYASDYSLTPQEIEKKTRNELGLSEKGLSTSQKQRILPVGVDENRGRFRARIRIKGKKVNLGSYGTPEEAQKAYEEARIKRDESIQ